MRLAPEGGGGRRSITQGCRPVCAGFPSPSTGLRVVLSADPGLAALALGFIPSPLRGSVTRGRCAGGTTAPAHRNTSVPKHSVLWQGSCDEDQALVCGLVRPAWALAMTFIRQTSPGLGVAPRALNGMASSIA